MVYCFLVETETMVFVEEVLFPAAARLALLLWLRGKWETEKRVVSKGY